MLLRCTPYQYRLNQTVGELDPAASSFEGNDFAASAIPSQEKRLLTHRFLISGLCNCGKLIPAFALGAGGVEISCELDAAANIVSTAATNHSTAYTLRNLRLHCDVVTLTTPMMEAYSSAVLASKPLLIQYSSWINTLQHFNNTPNMDVSVARQFAKLCSVFVTMARENSGDAKQLNTFFAPGAALCDNIQSFLSIGAKRWSDFDRTGAAQMWYYLKKTLGTLSSLPHGTTIGHDAYRTDSLIQAWDLEKWSGATATGETVKSGALTTISLKNVGTAGTAATLASRVYVCCHADHILELRDTGARVHN